MTDTVQPSTSNPDAINRQEEWAEALSTLRSRSSYSFKALATAIDRPTTTVHGWFSGRHLPYQRDNTDVEQMLRVLGVVDPAPWMEALARCRDEPAAPTAINPYPGLRPFTEDDVDRFFGRDDLIDAIRRVVAQGGRTAPTAPTVVIGASGSGKTSVLRAGLVPALRASGSTVRYTTPATEPSITRAEFGDDDTAPSVLIVDQFEELLREPSHVVQSAIVSLSAFAAAGHEVVIGLRSDYFHRAAQVPWLLAGLDERQVIVSAPSLDAMADLINGPASAAGLTVEGRLTVRLVDEFRDHDGSTAALPLLSYVLSRLVETRHGTELTLDAYEAEGRLDQALERAAERAYATLGADSRARAALLFKQLVELGGDALPTRRTVDLAALEATFGDDVDLEDVVGAFTTERLIVVDHDTVRLNHESMLTAWPRLDGWLDEERSSLAASHQVRVARTLWDEADHDDGMLLRGRALDRAEEVVDEPTSAGRLDADDRRFVAASAAVRDHDEERRRRRIRVLVGLTIVAALAAGLAMVFAVRANQASDEAEQAQGAALSRQLALQSTVLRPSDPTLSRQLALVAYDTAPTLEARSALIDASADMPTARYLGESGPTALAVAADGSRLAFSNSVAGSITIMRPTANGDFEREMELPLPDPEVDVYALALSPDGGELVSGGTDLFASLWDLDGDREPQVLDDAKTLFELPVQSVVFAPDGRTIYGSGTSTGIGVWDADGDPTTTSELVQAAGSTMAIDLHPERQLLAAANLDGTGSLFELSDPTTPVWQMPSEGDAGANTVDISPDGRVLALGYRSGVFRAWDISDLDDIVEVSPVMEPFGTWVNSVRFSPDGTTLVAGSDGAIRLWNTATWAEIGSVAMPTVVTNIRYLSDETGLVALADGSVRTFDLGDLSLQTLGATIWSTSFTPDGERLLASSRERTTVWQVEDGRTTEILAEIPPPDPDIGYSGTNAVSPDGRFAALGSRTGPIWLVDLDDLDAEPIAVTGLATLADELNDIEGSSILVENVSFSFDSSVVGAMGGDGYVQLWEVNGGDPVRAAGFQVAGFARNIVFHPSEPTLAIASDNGLVSLYDVSDPNEPELLSEIESGTDQAYGMAFHPTADIVATGNSDKTMTVWDIGDRREPVLLEQVTGPNSRLYDVAYDATGDRLAAAVGDNTMWLWDSSDTESVEVEAVLSLANGGVYAATFSPDGESLVGAGSDQRVFLWSLDEDVARAQVCTDIGEAITEAEWADLVPTLDYRSPCAG